MPYQVVKRGDTWSVVKEETGKLACPSCGGHKSKYKALAQMHAIYASEANKKK